MTGLGELFDEAEGRAESSAGGARLEGDELGAVHTRVRRAHARRSALRASLVAVAVVVVGVGVAYGVARGGAPVADEPGPSASATPSPSVSPSPSPSPSVTGVAGQGFAGTVTTDPHVPSASAVTEEVWESAGPGWALISYREAWVDSGDADVRGPQVVYLVSPQGDRYELVNVTGDTVSVLAWEAGATTAAVSVQPEGDPPFAGMLDLVTGEVTPIEGYAPYIWSVAFLDSDGVPIYTGNDATSAYVAIAPDGVQSEYTIPAEFGALELTKAMVGATGCGPTAPFSEQEVLVTCSFDGMGTPQAVERVSPQDGTVEEVFTAPGTGAIGPVSRAGDYVVGGVKTEALTECPTWYGAFSEGVGGSIAGPDDAESPNGSIYSAFGANGNHFVWGVSHGCGSDGAPMMVVGSDLDSDDYAVLVPYPEGRPAGEEPKQSVTGVAVAH